MQQSTPEPICAGSQIPELGKFAFTVCYRGERRAAVVVRHRGRVYGYLNQCLHMAKPLDCEDERIFDKSGRYLQCSVHGLCYDPASGEPLGGICAGQCLTALRVKEKGGWVYLADKWATLAV